VLVLKWFAGGSLKDYLAAKGPQSVAYAGELLCRIADVLHTAHGVGVIHRDVKPENILLDEMAHAYLTDFGIAKRSTANITAIGMMLGSPAYLAPEQLMSEPITPRTDGYALGVTLYETLLGEHPYAGLLPNQMMMRIVRQTFPPITSLRPELPEALDEFFRIATAYHPSDRFADLPAMAAAYQTATQPA
jgi:serine/threonine protein kinase